MIASSKTHRQKGEYQAAIIQLRNVLQQNPDHAEARYLLGTAYLESGEAAFATVELRKAQDLGYDPKLILPELGKSLIAQEKFKEALDATDPATVAGAQSSPEILNVRTFAQLGLRQLAAAKASLDLAMILRPDFADGMLMQARIALIEANPDAASALVDKALALDPKNVDGWLLKGNLQRQAGDTDKARSAFQRAVEVGPRSAAAHLDLASLDIAAQRFEDAALHLEAARDIAPRNVTGAYLQALLQLRTGNNKAALDAVYRALEIAPKHVPSTLLGGIAELALGHPEQAEKFLGTALELSPRNVYGRKMLAASQMQKRQFAEAVATLEPVLDEGAGASDPVLQALAGEAYMQNRQYAKATQAFEKAAALDPQNVATRIALGRSRMATGATDRAIADLEAAAALGPGGARADIMLVMLNLQRREFDQALTTLAKLEKAQPDNAIVYNMKAAAYGGKGDIAQARAQMERALKVDPAFFPAAANLAELDLTAGNVAQARKRYESVLGTDKNQTQAMLALAELTSRTRGPEKEVLDWIQRARTAAPSSTAPFRAEVDHYARTGQLDRALAVALEQSKLRPGDPGVLEILGRMLMAKGHVAEAVAVFGNRVVLLPNSPEAHVELAGAQMAAKDPAGAAGNLQKALRLRPGYPEAQAMLVAAELAQDRIIRALQVAKEVQNDMPKAPLGYVLEGDVLAATKKHGEAAALYEKAYALRKSGLVAIKIHDAWVAAGKTEQGEARIREWLAASPGDILTRRHFAYSLMQRGKYAPAIAQYRLVLERRPKDALALNNVAWAMSKLKDPAAVRYARQAYELNPGDAATADTLAQILIEGGDLPGGLEILQKAVAAAPAEREIRYHFAQALAKSGDKAKAIAQLESVVGSGAKFPQEAEAIALLKQLRQ